MPKAPKRAKLETPLDTQHDIFDKMQDYKAQIFAEKEKRSKIRDQLYTNKQTIDRTQKKLDKLIALSENAIARFRVLTKEREDSLANELSLNTELTKLSDTWENKNKLKMFNDDGSTVLTWINMELIFGYLWEPGDQKKLESAIAFQGACTPFRQAAQAYIRDNPFCNVTMTLHPKAVEVHTDFEYTDSYSRLQLTLTEKNAKRRIHQTVFNVQTSRTTNKWHIALIPTKQDQKKCAIVIKANHVFESAYVIGGKYLPNAKGIYVDWKYLPLTALSHENLPASMDRTRLVCLIPVIPIKVNAHRNDKKKKKTIHAFYHHSLVLYNGPGGITVGADYQQQALIDMSDASVVYL